MQNIGIMGGSFDPIHNGHLAAANEVLLKYNLDRVIFIPANSNPLKNNIPASGKHRLKMLKKAVKSNANFEYSDIEIKRNSKNTYTFNTLVTLSEIYPNDKLFFITGLDAIKDIKKWYKSDELFNYATFIAVTRPTGNLENRIDERIEILKIPALEISSSNLRERIKNNHSIMYLTPEKVVNYIDKHNIYK